MDSSVVSCPLSVNAFKTWPYQQYYFGKQDQQERKNGHGENHWSGAESLEWYSGKFVRNMMHGEGEYRWRYLGPEGGFITYEGHFYANRMHGYGVMSYPNGKVFDGLFYHNMRWGPGIESYSNLRENVGLWRNNQLVRLTWRPIAPSATFDLVVEPDSKTCADSHRIVLTTRVQTVGGVNSAIELLKQIGVDPITASQKWTKLYPKHCTDLASQLCHIERFDYEYYKNKIVELEEIDKETVFKENEDDSQNSVTYHAWNNCDMMVSMMKHCFKHEKQRSKSYVDLKALLSGPRSRYKFAAKHEIDCRTLIMASYLGRIRKIARLVNEDNVHPNVADMLGNTTLMYATCGNQPEVIHFLVQAGANVNSYNDSCCTPLGVALIQFACRSRDIATSDMARASVPPASSIIPLYRDSLSEWYIERNLSIIFPAKNEAIAYKKLNKLTSKEKRSKNDLKLSDTNAKSKKTDTEITDKLTEEADENFLKDYPLYHNLYSEFRLRVSDLMLISTPVPYLFEVVNMAESTGLDKHISNEKSKSHFPKVSNPAIKSEDKVWHNSETDVSSFGSGDQGKTMLKQSMSTILQLLSLGAEPRLVRCPQPALRIALASGSADLMRHLVKYGADINENYPDAFNYTILDIAVSQPVTYENLELTRVILECGARTDHRLPYKQRTSTNDPNIIDPINLDPSTDNHHSHHTSTRVPGPTLLHAVLAKQSMNYTEEQVRLQMLNLLLVYNCNPLSQFEGRSAVDEAMKRIDTLHVFLQCPKTDLNAVINHQNQTILVKMFTWEICMSVPITERLLTLTNLLAYGADPFLGCQDENMKFANFFVFANEYIIKLKTMPARASVDMKAKRQSVVPKAANKDSGPHAKGGSSMDGHIKDYKQALDLVKDLARNWYVKWIQANLFKELLGIVVKYEHRHWNNILPEHKNKTACGLWLSCPRSIEIWNILKKNKKKQLNDRRILKHILCIVQFNCNRSKTTFNLPLRAEEKRMIESSVNGFLYERKRAVFMFIEPDPLTRPHFVPELTTGADEKFQICLECFLPFGEQKILCDLCAQVSFCSYDCMKWNIYNNCETHPCSGYLKKKHFPDNTTTPIKASI